MTQQPCASSRNAAAPLKQSSPVTLCNAVMVVNRQRMIHAASHALQPAGVCDSLLHGLSAALNQSLHAYMFRLACPHTPQPAPLFRKSLRLQVSQHLKSHMMLLPVLLPNTVPTTRPAVLQTLQRPMQGCQCCCASCLKQLSHIAPSAVVAAAATRDRRSSNSNTKQICSAALIASARVPCDVQAGVSMSSGQPAMQDKFSPSLPRSAPGTCSAGHNKQAQAGHTLIQQQPGATRALPPGISPIQASCS